MKLIDRIFKSISFRLSRLIYNTWTFPINSIRYKFWGAPNVATLQETLNLIIEKGCSICRFGDGEFNIALGRNIGFQHQTDDIQERMLQVLRSNEKRILIAIPDIFDDLSKYEPFTKHFWTEYRIKNLGLLQTLFPVQTRYYNSFITRFTTDYAKDQAEVVIPLMKQIWNNKSVYIIEGIQSKIGVGNDLLENAKAIHRIIAPGTNAYDYRNEIMGAVTMLIPNGALVILALGPAATILAYDLSLNGFQALDFGHFDIQYEHHIRGFVGKHGIPGKLFNEACAEGYSSAQESIESEEYESQIIYRIKNK